MQHLPSTQLLPPRGRNSVMTRGIFFGEMTYSRLTRLLSDRELYLSQQNHCGESVVRCCSFMQFCCVSLFSLVTVMTPWMLSAAELVIMLVLYFTVVPESADLLKDSSGITHDHFARTESFKDILICSIIRVAALSVSYAFAFTKYQPYYYIAWITSLILIPYAIAKAALVELSPVGPALSLILTLILFSVVHLIVAHATKKRLQRRVNLGLSEFNSRWDEENWVMNGGSLDFGSTASDAIQESFLSADDDIPRDVLKDKDSKFIDCGGLSVHYKEELPEKDDSGPGVDLSFAVMLIHGFGGGVFAWRHIMKPLAEICQCRVVAFDRPAFGLTARPQCDETSTNPYKLQSQQALVLELCEKLGIQRVMIVAHADGCIPALMLGAALNPLNTNIPRKSAEKARRLSKATSAQKDDSAGPIMIGLSIRRTFSDAGESQLEDISEETVTNTDVESGVDLTIDAILKPATHPSVQILAMVFLHPDLSSDEGPAFTSLLKQSKIARKVLRPLLRSDIGEVSSRRAWYDTTKLTKEVLELYKAPLRIRGWDSALVAYTKEKRSIAAEDLKVLRRRVIGLPLLVVTGEKDRIVPPERAASIADDLRVEHRSVLPNCGHLSHEEAPHALLETLVVYIKHIYELYEDL